MIIELENTLISSEIFTSHFVCDLDKCKGACCVEGDRGAPLEAQEIKAYESSMEGIKKHMEAQALELLELEGFHEGTEIDDPATNCLPGGECIFAYRDPNGVLGCAIEKAYLSGDSAANKPISCHLYPIRIGKAGSMETLNYHRWDICSAACTLGEKLQQPLYRFLKAPLVRKYGEAWYGELELIYTDFKNSFPDIR